MDFAAMKRRELQALCKRHGLPAGGTNAALAARLADALSGDAGAEEDEVEVAAARRKGCLKRSEGGGDAGEAKKVTFALAEETGARGRRRRKSQVVLSPVVARARGRGKAAEALPADIPDAEVSGRGRRQQRRAQTGGDSAGEAVAAEAGSGVPVRRSRRISLGLSAADAEEVGEAVSVDRKRKRKSEENSQDVAVSAQVGVSCRVTRRSSLSGAAVLLPPAAEKKKGRGKAVGCKNELVAEAQELSEVPPPAIVESRRRTRKGEGCEPDEQKPAEVQVSGRRTTRSRSVAAVAMSRTVVENKRKRKIKDAQPDVELPTVSEVTRNDAPVTRASRNRAVQTNSFVGEDTNIGKNQLNKMQPSGPTTRRRKQVASSVEEEDQEFAAPNKDPPLRRLGRNSSDARNANSEINKSSSEAVEAKGLNIPQTLACNAAKSEHVEKQPAAKEPVRRSTRKSVVSATLEKDEKDLVAENPEAQVRRSTRKSVGIAKDIQVVGEDIQNAKGEDVPKQPAIKEPVRRSTRKSIASSMHEKEEKDPIVEKDPKIHVRRSTRKSVVPVKDTEGVGEGIQNFKGEDVEKQLTVKDPVRRSSRKSVLPDKPENQSGLLVAGMNAEAHVRRSMRKPVLSSTLNKDSQDQSHMAGNEDFQSGQHEDEENQLKVKEPVRRSRRSVATKMLDDQNKGLHEQKKSEIPTKKSTRKSVVLNAIEKEKIYHTEVDGRDRPVGARKLEGSVQLTDVAVATSGNKSQVEVAVQNSQSVERSAQKSSNHNLSPMETSSPANNSSNTEDFGGHKFRKQQSAQTRRKKDCIGANHEKPVGTQQISNSTFSMEKPTKRRRTTAPEEVMSMEEAKSDDMAISEATQDGDEVTHEYSKGSSSTIKQICQFDATGEELSSCPLLEALPDEICNLLSVPKVIPGSESGDVHKWGQNPENYHPCATESSEKSKQAQEHSDFKFDYSHLSETTKGKLDQPSSTAELIPHTGIEGEVNIGAKGTQIVNERSKVGLEASNKSADITEEIRSTTGVLNLEAEAPMDEACAVNSETIEKLDEGVLQIDFTVRDREEQSPIHEQGRVGGEENTSESGADVMPTGLDTKDPQHDADIVAQETGKDVPIDCIIEEHKEHYPVSPIAVENRVNGDGESSAIKSAGKSVAGILPTDIHTKDLPLPHGCDVPTKQVDEASEHTLTISDSKPEIHCEVIAEESIEVADLVKCLSKGSKGNPLLTNLHLEGAAEDSILPVLNAATRCSSDGRRPSFGLKFLFPEERKESYSRNSENTTVEVECGNKPTNCEKSHSFYAGSDCGMEDKDVQSIGCDADKKLDMDHGVAQEEVVAEKRSNDEHVAAKINLKTKSNDGLYMESSCSLAEKSTRLLDDEEAMVQFQHGNVQEGTLEKSSLCSAMPKCKHECGLPKEAVLQSVNNKRCLSSVERFSFPTVHSENGVDELKDCHVNSALEKMLVSKSVPPQDTHEDSCLGSRNSDCMHTSEQYNGIEGSQKANHDGEQVSSSQSGFVADANHNELNNFEEVASNGDGTRKLVHSEYLSTSSGKSDVNAPGSTLAESTDFLDETIGCSNTEVLQKGHKSRCNEDREKQVASESCTDGIIEATTANIESGIVLSPSEERSVLQDGQRNSKLEGAKVMESGLNCNNDDSNTLNNGSVIAIVGKRTSSGSSLPKDPSTDQQELLIGTSFEGSATFGEKTVPRNGGTMGNPSFRLASPDYTEEHALSECTGKNSAGTLPPNPRALLMELQSLYSEENIEELNPHDGLDFPSSESLGEASADVEWRAKEHLGSKLSLLESIDSLDEQVEFSNTEVLHQSCKYTCNEDRKDQIPSAPCTDDIREDATVASDIESAVNLMPPEEIPDLKDGYLNPKEGAKVEDAGLNCSKDAINSLDNGSAVSIAGQRTPFNSRFRKDSPMNQYLKEDISDDFLEEKSFESVSRVGGAIENPSFNLATPDHTHEDALSVEAAHLMKNFAGTCSSNPGQLLMQLQNLFSEENVEESDLPGGLAFPCTESREVSMAFQVEEIVEQFISSESDTCQRCHQNFSRAEEKDPQDRKYEGVPESYTSETAQVEGMENATVLLPVAPTSALLEEQLDPKLESHEGEEHSVGCEKDTSENFNIGSVQNDLSQLPKDCHMDSSLERLDDFSVPKSASGEDESVLGSGPCQTNGQNCIATGSVKDLTSGTEVLNQDYEEHSESVEVQITSIGMSEAAPTGRPEGGVDLTPAAVTSALQDEQLNPELELEGDKVEEHSSSSFENNGASNLTNDTQIAHSREENHPNDLSAPRSPEECTVFQNDSVPGSVGIPRSSCRRGIDEIRAMLQRFKVSSTVKGSYIAMSAPRPKQGDALSQSAIALLRNRENTPAVKADHPAKPNPDRSAANGSSRRALQPIPGRPSDH